jgi:regulatory protein
VTTAESTGLKITSISVQAKNKNRVNVFVNGKYRFSVDIFQVSELGLKVGKAFSPDQLNNIETEGQYSKLYSRALEYSLVRPRSRKEMRDYLWKKTLDKKYRAKSGEVVVRPGLPVEVTNRVLDRLVEKGYVNDESFACWWVECRNQTKGASRRKLQSELLAKGINHDLIEKALAEANRNDREEILKIIAKKQKRYPDKKKFVAYLVRQGFSYDDVQSALDDFK